MPAIGEIRGTRAINPKGGHRHIWVACIDCGKERWVQLVKGEPRSQRCGNCARGGNNNPHWKGGKWRTGTGYIMVYCPWHPYANKHGYVREHRLVLEKKLGRYLMPGEVSHHVNGIKDDNSPENTEFYPSFSTHTKKHWEERKSNE